MAPHRLSIPLKRTTHSATGLVRVFAELPLFVRTDAGKYAAGDFLVDTGATVTEVGVDWARSNSIPITGVRTSLNVTHGGGSAVWTGWLGTIRVRIPTWTGVEFTWFCFFREKRPPNLPLQLGLSGVLADIQLLFDGTPTPTAPVGTLIVESV